MTRTIKEAIILGVLAIVLAFAANTVSPKGISLKGTWYDNREKQELEIPPSYDPQTDSLLTMQEAFMLWKNGSIFIDARDPENYDEGHIPGAINLPFEEWDDYWEAVRPQLNPDSTIVCYCDGFDCELSLFAARELKLDGYPKALTFFGGFHKWVNAKLPYDNNLGQQNNASETDR